VEAEEKQRAAAALAKAIDAERRGDKAIAWGYFKQVVKIYPGTPEAAEAMKRLEQPQVAEQPPVTAQAAIAAATHTAPPVQLVRVVDVDISFGQLVSLFVKAAIAMIPAAIILAIIGFIVFAILAGLVGGSGALR